MDRRWWLALGAAGGVGLLLGLSATGPSFTRLLTLPTQAFPGSGYPGALVHSRGVRNGTAWVYFRGWGSCVAVVGGSLSGACYDGGSVHQPSDIVGQFDRAGAPGLLVLPELRVEANSGDPGQLRTGFDAFLDDVGREAGVRIDHVVLASHSGGYQAVAAALRTTRRAVVGVALLDSLYGDVGTFAAYGQAGGRLAVIAGASTATHAEALAGTLGVGVRDGGVSAAGLRSAPTTVWRVQDGHSEVPRYWGDVVAAWR